MQNASMKIDFAPVKTLNDVDKLLIAADGLLMDGRRSAVIIGQAHMHILKSMPTLSFTYFERRYRAFTSNTYLLAPAIKYLDERCEARHWKTNRLTKYFIWICVNGEKEARQTMHKFNIEDAESNLIRLEKTGFVNMKAGHKVVS
jgi:hypothetical protein